MLGDLEYILKFIVSQWSFTPESFKQTLVNAAMAKIAFSFCWWIARLWGSKFPQDKVPALVNAFFNTKPVKLVTLVLDFTLIDVFLFLSVVAVKDLRVQFSYFSLWAAALFCFLVVYMLLITHRDLKSYR
jgi:hypothetical protein